MMTKGSEDEARSSARNLMFGVCHPQPYHGKVEQILHVMKSACDQ